MTAALKQTAPHVRLRQKVANSGPPFWADAVVDRQSRGLAVTQDVWASDASLWTVTHLSSGRALGPPLKKRDARWLMAQALKRRVAWTKPMKALLKSLSKKERATLGFLISAACEFSGVERVSP